MELRKYASVALEGLLLQTWKAATQLIFGGLFIFLLSIVLIILASFYILGFAISSELSDQLLWWPITEFVEILQFAITVSVILSIGILRVARDPPELFFAKKSDIILGPTFIASGLWLHKEFAEKELSIPAIYINLSDGFDTLDLIGVPSISLFLLGIFTISTGLVLLGLSRIVLYITHLSIPNFSGRGYEEFKKYAYIPVTKFGELLSLHKGIRAHSKDIKEGYFTTVWILLSNNTGESSGRLRYLPQKHLTAEGVDRLVPESENTPQSVEEPGDD